MDYQFSIAPGVSKTRRQLQDGSFSEFVSVAPQNGYTASFSETGGGLDRFFNPPSQTGSISFSQSSGNLNIDTGITPNSEFLARSQESFSGSMRMRASIVSSQRIVNSNLSILLADLIGENLSYSATATSVTVNFPANHSFNSLNVGQFIFVGGISGPAGIPGRYAIASVPSSSVLVLTVSGWGVETGILTLFGWNHIKTVLSGATATSFFCRYTRTGVRLGRYYGNIEHDSISRSDYSSRDGRARGFLAGLAPRELRIVHCGLARIAYRKYSQCRGSALSLFMG
jgi:hypothetical protein